MIIRARTVVTMDGAPIENGAVAVSGNQIADVGKFDQIRARNAGPARQRARAHAALPAMSCRASRRSKARDAVKRSAVGSVRSVNRPAQGLPASRLKAAGRRCPP